jgi:hypothetical protein
MGWVQIWVMGAAFFAFVNMTLMNLSGLMDSKEWAHETTGIMVVTIVLWFLLGPIVVALLLSRCFGIWWVGYTKRRKEDREYKLRLRDYEERGVISKRLIDLK